MSLNDAKTYAEIVEIAFKVIALILAGFWALYGFYVFRQRQKAVTDLRKVEAETASLELQAKRRAVLDISINHQCHKDLDSDGYVLVVQIVLVNGGVSPAYIQFEDDNPPVRVHRVVLDGGGGMSFPDSPIALGIRNTSDPTKLARSRLIRAGGTSRLSTVVRLPQGGVYLTSFRVEMDDANRQAMLEINPTKTSKSYWSATAITTVGFPAEAKGGPLAAGRDGPAGLTVAQGNGL
jgi:hypothetical protein